MVSNFLEYDPTTKPVQLIEYDRLQAEEKEVTQEELKHYNLPPARRMVLICNGKNPGICGRE
ncbi:MAG: hypothetical protein ACUVXA_19635 [Candidatus Jordarchaeum sp.]|uniref:hypothetical protein n=1 Tax=Candidatus Jordarchaeum sp. TaxID=2823881 RepID=UPI004049D2C6